MIVFLFLCSLFGAIGASPKVYWFFVVCRFLVGFSIGEFALAEMQGLGSSWGHRQSNAKASLWFGSDLNSCAPLIEPGGGSVSLLKVFPLTLLTLLSWWLYLFYWLVLSWLDLTWLDLTWIDYLTWIDWLIDWLIDSLVGWQSLLKWWSIDQSIDRLIRFLAKFIEVMIHSFIHSSLIDCRAHYVHSLIR